MVWLKRFLFSSPCPYTSWHTPELCGQWPKRQRRLRIYGWRAPNRQGWWGDTFAEAAGDRIGSRLWLLQRQKVLSTTLRRAEAYAKESLQWLIDDAVVARIEVSAERSGVDQIALLVTCYRPDDTQALQARFQNVWE